VLPLALPKQLREGKVYETVPEWDYALAFSTEQAHAALKANATRGHRLIDCLSEHLILSTSQLRPAGFDRKLAEDLLAKGILKILPRQKVAQALLKSAPLTLHSEQAQAVHCVLQSPRRLSLFFNRRGHRKRQDRSIFTSHR
jgi:primosomal protein N'